MGKFYPHLGRLGAETERMKNLKQLFPTYDSITIQPSIQRRSSLGERQEQRINEYLLLYFFFFHKWVSKPPS